MIYPKAEEMAGKAWIWRKQTKNIYKGQSTVVTNSIPFGVYFLHDFKLTDLFRIDESI